jgi:uncharacterized membrane protein YbhN (UPF0104 family)
MKAKLKRILGPIIIVLTIVAFIWYVQAHPWVIDELKQTEPLTIVLIVFAYAGSLGALAYILQASLKLYDKFLPYTENFLLTAYSSIINFFGPGQSGPGVRAVYLKVKHGFSLKRFMFVTLIYFAWFAFISGVMVGAAALPWWLTTFGVVGIAGASMFVIWHFVGKSKVSLVPTEARAKLVRTILLIGFGTAAQLFFIAVAYYIELRSVDASVSLGQALSYTGAANFALFVSITPGAIGIREAFLLFSQNIHGISPATIAAASILDRAVYFIVLGILALIVAVTHAGKRFQTKTPATPDSPDAVQ